MHEHFKCDISNNRKLISLILSWHPLSSYASSRLYLEEKSGSFILTDDKITQFGKAIFPTFVGNEILFEVDCFHIYCAYRGSDLKD